VLAARMARCPRILVTIHGTVRDLQRYRSSWRRAALQHGAEPLTLRAATHVATVCEYAADRDFVRRFSAKFSGVVPNGVPLSPQPRGSRERIRQQIGVGPEDRVLITVSRVTWEKGFATLAEALRRLPRQPRTPVVLVVGDGPDLPAVRSALSVVPGMDIRFLGRRLDVPDLLSAADVFVFPTLHENLSVALLEAMAQELPAVASAVGGNVEILARGGGVLVPAHDAVALSAAVEGLLTDPAERRVMGRSARHVVARHYSLDVMLNALDSLYQRILAA
jgi:glycosyltransferase involved in cell wall biosynthesis